MKSLIATLILLLAAPLLAKDIVGERHRNDVQTLFEIACELTADYADCPTVTPAVVYTKTRDGIRGMYYPGSQLIFMSDKFHTMPRSVYEDGITIHEMVHYILDVNDLLQSRADDCRNEGAAWAVYNAYVIQLGRPDLERPEWYESYNGCTPKNIKELGINTHP